MKSKHLHICWLLLAGLAASSPAAGYRTSLGTAPDSFPLVVVSGTPYQMGLALGTLMKPEIQKFLPFFLMEAQLAGGPELSATNLDQAWRTMEPFISSRFKDELRGVAEGSGAPLVSLQRAHMVPVISEYSCSGIAVWGSATRTGHLYQIRDLDYTTKAHLQDYRCVVIYVPSDGIAHLNPSFAGSIGCHTGMNAEGITLTEIGDSPASDKPYDLHGLHFMMMFRDILYSAHTLDQAVQMIKDTPRIKKYHFFVGDGKIPAAVKMKAWAPGLQIWKDNDPTDELAPEVLPNAVYHAESRDPTAWGHLSEYAHGRYDMDAIIQLSKAVGTLGGNLMNAAYDATAREAWLSYAYQDQCAYRRAYVQVKLSDFIPYNAANPKVTIQQTVP
ncbi:MAG TPA: C45 family peptidase [Verrucomicrobiae bacterium]|nr:C45 family peptidase [Verrucomicrobiae bacterium]